MKWFGKHATVLRSRKLTLGISGHSQDDKQYVMNVRTIRNLSLPAQTVDPEALHRTNPHLREVPLTPYENAVPRILIGLDNHHLGIPREVKADDDEEGLVAVRTKLGWVVYGSDEPTNPPNSMVFLVDGKRDELLHQIEGSSITSSTGPGDLVDLEPTAAVENIFESTTDDTFISRKTFSKEPPGVLDRMDEMQRSHMNLQIDCGAATQPLEMAVRTDGLTRMAKVRIKDREHWRPTTKLAVSNTRWSVSN